MFHGQSLYAGVTSGVTIGVTKLEKICPDFQTVKCQV